ncbi:hypothetical protein CEUSTIGMA_g926.t1 [Chlamydomonas eustigma]|uniref:Uncharacterized protein n=1 Tax=Chlamydomonas eustigma TaxID=1157962 RepID=A0A250WRJ8_9CHLO|nr:hypothetical protein CEUSTIGMA_g926.t1 [Chlamydomonas eustigma]|eukprot:GAX73474.1 hypothetical protein CEUSTIGMA_g926.t1 [Chlamydomonas eustigma]
MSGRARAIISSASKPSPVTRNGSLPRQVSLDFVHGPDANKSKADLDVTKSKTASSVKNINASSSTSGTFAERMASLASSALDLVTPFSGDNSDSPASRHQRPNILEAQRSLARGQAKIQIPGSMDFEIPASPVGSSAASMAVLSSLPLKEPHHNAGDVSGSGLSSAGSPPFLRRTFSGAQKQGGSTGATINGLSSGSFRMNIQQSHLEKQQSIRKERDFICKTATDLVTVPEGSDFNPESSQQRAAPGVMLSPLPSSYQQQSSFKRVLGDLGGNLHSPLTSSSLISGSSISMSSSFISGSSISTSPSTVANGASAAGTKASSVTKSPSLLRERVQAVHVSKQESLRAGRQARRPKNGALWDPMAVGDEYV